MYSPRIFKGDNIEELAKHVELELSEIGRALSETTSVELRLVHVEPSKPREGMLVAADGTDWNPGGGIGIYAYLSGAWSKL